MKKVNEQETEALQNFATKLGLIVNRYYESDARKREWKYYLTKEGTVISPTLNYEGLNLFMIGFNRCLEINTQQKAI